MNEMVRAKRQPAAVPNKVRSALNESHDNARRTVLLPSIAPSLHEGCLAALSAEAVRKPVMFACSLSIGIVRSQTVQSMKRLSQTWNTSCTYVHLTMRGDLKFPV